MVTLVVGLVAVCFLPQDGQLKSQLSIVGTINLSLLLNRSAYPHSFFFFISIYHIRAGEMACECETAPWPRFRPRGEVAVVFTRSFYKQPSNEYIRAAWPTCGNTARARATSSGPLCPCWLSLYHSHPPSAGETAATRSHSRTHMHARGSQSCCAQPPAATPHPPRPRQCSTARACARWSGGGGAAGALLAAGGDVPSRAHLPSEGGGRGGCQGAGRGVTRRRGGQSQGRATSCGACVHAGVHGAARAREASPC